MVVGQVQLQQDQSKDKSKVSANTVLDFTNAKREVFATLMDWKLSVWSSQDQKDSGRRPVVQIPIDRNSCILEKDSDLITVTNVDKDTEESTTWILSFGDDDKENQVSEYNS